MSKQCFAYGVACDLEAILDRLFQAPQVLDVFGRPISDADDDKLFQIVMQAAVMARDLHFENRAPANEDTDFNL